ncbi:hypothetical protein BLA29_000475 [Euroglyphus maynei]|uniref:Uncharacterized protein n=1 Tax=Euroglyphus maynei TaxID=6958 RepID=A0A1Y3AXU2_EURMA|nr:hypothetical protein BLA29_000475 [Euroglyphus maynei]
MIPVEFSFHQSLHLRKSLDRQLQMRVYIVLDLPLIITASSYCDQYNTSCEIIIFVENQKGKSRQNSRNSTLEI